ncbi:GIY-YIG nuclease family protein [Celeribacter litoreus]|uniref:GIY-YIG nuclease family protein n=1 Tax=Celeribacter litoreus TaxID=2876714 RepID=UPI001CCF1F74|nr:GIY-YIG nuclease family protein [Celeribacter litoreus]MCA0042412.1 GIY-YIG nuclease family protein [Celeribacter litoreus]
MTTRIMGHAAVVRAMRPLQRQALQLILADAELGNLPSSRSEAFARYSSKMGPGFSFDTRKGWAGDIRHAAIICLLEHGLIRGGALDYDEVADALTNWITDVQALTDAGNLEIEHGGNSRLIEERKISSANTKFFGEGSECVYVYTDSILDRANFPCCKIGRHVSDDIGAVLGRVFGQYGTGNPGIPILRYIMRTNDAASLEIYLHRHFDRPRLRGGTGTEWFELLYTEVKGPALEHLAELKRKRLAIEGELPV